MPAPVIGFNLGPKPGSVFAFERMGTTRTPSPPTYPGVGGATLKTYPAMGNVIDKGPGSPAAMDGLPIAGLSAVLVKAALCQQWTPGQPMVLTGDTFAGAGTLQCWIATPLTGIPFRYPDLDLSFSWSGVTAQGTRGWPVLREVGRLGAWMWFISNAVTITGVGADFVVTMEGFQDVGGVH